MAEIYSDINQAVLRNVPAGSLALDVGCGTGILGAELKKRDCTVYGIEYSKGSASLARTKLEKVIIADLEQEPPRLDERFDVVIFADVLEHLRDPEQVLKRYLRFSKPNGTVVVSLPNIANWTMRMKLLFGSFNYKETGILDRTHLHFYTLTTARKLMEGAGLRVIKIDLNPNFVRSCLGLIKSISSMFGIKGKDHEVHEQLLNSKAFRFYAAAVLPIETMIAKAWRRLFAYQFILVGKNDAAEAAGALTEIATNGQARLPLKEDLRSS